MSNRSSGFSIIFAMDEEGGIGKNGKLPWRIPEEMSYFKEVTTTTMGSSSKNLMNAVIMGRKTWESIPEKFKPLQGRINVVVTSQRKSDQPLVASSLDAALQFLKTHTQVWGTYIIGGAQLYREALDHPSLTGIFRTIIHKTYDCDTFMPHIPSYFELIKAATKVHESKKGTKFTTEVLIPKIRFKED